MSQLSFAEVEYVGRCNKTRSVEFLAKMKPAVPWKVFANLVDPHYPKPGIGRPLYPLETMLRIYFTQLWISLSDPAMEETLCDSFSMRQFVKLPGGRVLNETNILNFRHLLERHNIVGEALDAVNLLLRDQSIQVHKGTVVDAKIIDAPSSTKNANGTRAPEMHQTKKGNQWHFLMKAHIGVDLHSGLAHTVVGGAANEHDVTQAAALLHGEETLTFRDAGYPGVDKRPEHLGHDVMRHIAMRPGKRFALGNSAIDRLTQKIERAKSSLRAKIEHPFCVIKCQFVFRKVKLRGPAKNSAHLKMLFTLFNIWMARPIVDGGGRISAPKSAYRPLYGPDRGRNFPKAAMFCAIFNHL